MTPMPIIDCDFHHMWLSPTAITDHVPAEWQEYFAGAEKTAMGMGPRRRMLGRLHPPMLRWPMIDGFGGMRDGGYLVASNYEGLRDGHLDPYGITRVVMTWSFGLHPGLHNAQASAVLARATNDFMMDYWFGQDDERIRGVICVPVGDPEAAAAEVARVAPLSDKWAGVLVANNPFHKPLGNPVYHPILRAATDHGLPVIAHLGSDADSNGSLTGGGMPTTQAEDFSNGCQPGMHHLSSLLTEGVFEKFPTLNVLFNEYGVAWVPWLLWGLDSRVEGLRKENPSLTKLPSEYFREHVWMGSQPFASEARPKRVIELLEAFGGMDEKICYASDFPHHDSEWPEHLSPRIPEDWQPKVFGENGAKLFGWSMDELRASAAKFALAEV